MLELYHCKGSRSVRPYWTILEMGLEHKVHPLTFPPRVNHPEYLSVNPLGTVPALLDGDVMLTESVSICQYIGQKYGPTDLILTPDEQDYGAYLNWLGRADATLTFPLTITFRYGMLEPKDRRLPQAAEDYKIWFLNRWKSVETALSGRTYLCAERFTIADICVVYALIFASHLGIREAFTPNVSAWWDRLSTRPHFKTASLMSS